jgi:hypothetical protein
MRKTEAGGRLYSYWRRIKAQGISPEFAEFPGFYIWAIKNGYTLGAKLYKYDPAEPYGPENCFWVPRDEWVGGLEYPPMSQEWRQKWDETINRIRLHFGMEPIGTWEE